MSQPDVEAAFESLCTELLALACLIETTRPAGAPLEFHRNDAVRQAVARCIGRGERLSELLTPHARAGSWRRTVGSFNRERRVLGEAASESDGSKAP